MNQELITMTEKWKSLERQTEQQRQEAESFYENELMGLIEETFIANNRGRMYEQAKYMILSVGTSYEPLVLNIQLFRSKKILFLYTEKSEYVLEKIVRHCGLDAMRFSKRQRCTTCSSRWLNFCRAA